MLSDIVTETGPHLAGWKQKDVCGYGAICSDYIVYWWFYTPRAQTFLTLVMIEIVCINGIEFVHMVT